MPGWSVNAVASDGSGPSSAMSKCMTWSALRATAAMPLSDPPRRICHWSPYLRPGTIALYRALIDGSLSARDLPGDLATVVQHDRIAVDHAQPLGDLIALGIRSAKPAIITRSMMLTFALTRAISAAMSMAAACVAAPGAAASHCDHEVIEERNFWDRLGFERAAISCPNGPEIIEVGDEHIGGITTIQAFAPNPTCRTTCKVTDQVVHSKMKYI